MQADNTEVFTAAYAGLNSGQRQAVDAIDGPVMVIAGPGTGKTEILTLRIANILLKTDTAPEGILALTFTEAGARAMRERLHKYIGAAAYRVPIYTFHAFADDLIRRYPEQYDRLIGSRAAADIEKVRLIEDILAGGTYPHLRPLGNPIFYVRPILQAIATLKREYITPDALAESIARMEQSLDAMPRVHEKGVHKGKVRGEYQKLEKQIGRTRELLVAYRAYEAGLRAARLYDFDDMILETVRACEGSEDYLRELQETYQYLLADEHQDVNGSQNRILDLLASFHERPNIFVVGDEKQAIYRFQGASLENFLYFEERFPDTTIIPLTDNYRSGQRILDLAHSLIAVDDGPQQALRVPLRAARTIDATAEYRQFGHQAVEDEWVVARARELIASGVPGHEIAIIVRTNREVEAFARLAKKAAVPVHVSSEKDILAHPVVGMVRALAGAAVHAESEDALFRALHGAHWGIEPSDLVKLFAARSYTRPLAHLIRDDVFLRDSGFVRPEAIRRVGTLLDVVRRAADLEPPHRTLETLVRDSGLIASVTEIDPLEGGSIIRRLYDEVEGMVVRGEARTLADVVRIFDAYETYGIEMTAPVIAGPQRALSIMTAHKAKGLEFGHVFVPHLTEQGWGGTSRGEYFSLPLTRTAAAEAFDPEDDERRLLYVAITRAKEGVYLSSAAENADGRAFVPSRLLSELDQTLLDTRPTQAEEDAFTPTAALATHTAIERLPQQTLTDLFLGRGLSATALNNYLQSPWQYIYRNVLRIPAVQPTHMLFGTALHSVLQLVSEHRRATGAVPGATEISRMLERRLGMMPITKEEFVQLHEKGLASILAYLDATHDTFGPHAREEFSLRVMLPTGDALVPEIPLTGTLDRLVMDEHGTVLRVIDYKSGKPKTRGFIEGTTKDSNGDYKRQLVFYALLLSLYEDPRYACREGVISFIEPDDKGRIREEAFTISDADIDDLRAEILRVAREITSGAWMHAPCDPAVCEYCDLAAALVKEVS